MGRGGPNGPSSLPRLRLRSSDSNRPCSLLDVSRVDARKWKLAVAGRGWGSRAFTFNCGNAVAACRPAAAVGKCGQAVGRACATRSVVHPLSMVCPHGVAQRHVHG